MLRNRAREVEVFDEELTALVRDMFETMVAAEGAGLAAPQVGVPLRVFVADVREEDREKIRRLALVNPTLVWEGEEEARASEGCLSIPGVSEVVARPAEVAIEAMDPGGRPVRVEGDGLLARVLQHELDHLNGVLFIDRISALKRRMLLKKYRRLREKEEM